MTKPENPPAFARPESEQSMGSQGMTLRDYFAAAALPMCWHSQANNGRENAAKRTAELAYENADAMLKERLK